MASNQTYTVSVDQFQVDRNNLGWMERTVAAIRGRWPKVWLHKIECPCCGKVTFHRAVRRKN